MASTEKRDTDPSTGRKVPSKRVNQAYLVHQRWLEKQERIKERAKARAEGRTLEPSDLDEDDDNAALGNFVCTMFMTAIIVGVIAALSGLFLHNDMLWGYRGKWTNWHNYIPTEQHVFTMERLAEFNGEHPNRPILVFDVSAGEANYGKGGAYNMFAGRDASRAYVTGCFKTHLTHDTRGFSEAQQAMLDSWHKFYANHHTYYKVGTAKLPPIHPASPIPPPCRDNVAQKP